MNIQELRVRDLMQKDVKTIEGGMTLLAATRMMCNLHVSSLIVKPKDDKDAFGILTRKDIVESLIADQDDSDSVLVEERHVVLEQVESILVPEGLQAPAADLLPHPVSSFTASRHRSLAHHHVS